MDSNLLDKTLLKSSKWLLVSALISISPFIAANETSDEISLTRKNEIKNLLLQDCGSCHGMTMKGGLGPALTPEELQSRPREFLQITILKGRPGTPMPPWENILSKQEANWLIDVLYSGVTK